MGGSTGSEGWREGGRARRIEGGREGGGEEGREGADNHMSYKALLTRFGWECISHVIRPVARGVQGVLENLPFYEPPILENTNPPPP